MGVIDTSSKGGNTVAFLDPRRVRFIPIDRDIMDAWYDP